MSVSQIFQLLFAGLSFVFYYLAFYFFTAMPVSKKLIESYSEMVVFGGGFITWLVWMGLLRGMACLERYLEPHEGTFWGKLGFLVLRAPGMIIFPSLSVLTSQFLTAKDGSDQVLTNENGVKVFAYLSVSSVFLQMMFVHITAVNDSGMTDLLEASHLPLLPQTTSHNNKILKNFSQVLFVSAVYYLRQFVIFFAREIVVWWQRGNQPQVAPQVEEDIEMNIVDAAHQNLRLLVKQTNDFIDFAGTSQVFAAARNRGLINDERLLEFDRRLNSLTNGVMTAETYLEGIEEVV